ncbi:MAG TPA: helix-turn-helix domain-containing protein [Gaiellaceae bacterium]|jgi:excisionase family DNA binding protein|nr:helix-turn-helix domain-containing protein [Gaiellaceae bacterium]
MTGEPKLIPLLERGSQRLPEWKFGADEVSATTQALRRALRASSDDRLTQDEQQRELADALGLSETVVSNLGLPDALARLNDAVGAVEQVVGSLTVALPPDFLNQLVELVTAEVADRLAAARDTTPPKMLTVKQAAALIGAKPQRIYDLLSQRRLTRYKEGGRTLVSREELEALVRPDAAALVPKR